MNIKTSKESVMRYASALSKISAKNSPETVVKNVKISAVSQEEKKELNLSVTNFETFLHVKIPADFDAEGSICVNTEKLISVVKEFPEGTIDFLVDMDRHWVSLKTGGLEAKLPGIDPEFYPAFEWDSPENRFEIEASRLVGSLRKVVNGVPDNTNLNYLRGMCVRALDDSTVEFCGSDSMRIARFLYQAEGKVPEGMELIIPKKSCLEIIDIFDKEKDSCEFSFNENVFVVRSNKVSYQTQLIKDKFPEIRRFFERESDSTLTVSMSGIMRFLRVMRAMSDDLQHSVKIKFSPDSLEMIGEKKHYEANDTLACKFEGELEWIAFNVNLLYNGLSSFGESSKDEIKFHFNTRNDPCVLLCEGMENYQYICMPMKISW